MADDALLHAQGWREFHEAGGPLIDRYGQPDWRADLVALADEVIHLRTALNEDR